MQGVLRPLGPVGCRGERSAPRHHQAGRLEPGRLAARVLVPSKEGSQGWDPPHAGRGAPSHSARDADIGAPPNPSAAAAAAAAAFVAAQQQRPSGAPPTGAASQQPGSSSSSNGGGALGGISPTGSTTRSSSSGSPGASPNASPGASPSASASSAGFSSAGSVEDLADASLWELLINPDVEAAVARAKSASDASLLRRKGHLKEQDKWIEYIRTMHETHTVEEVMAKMERWIAEHRRDPRRSRLRRIVPTVGSFFTPLKLTEAFREYDTFFHLSRRRYIPPNFAELRHILNIAQVHASAEDLRLITFDADGTLYADGHHIEQDSEMIRLIVSLMRLNIHVAIVTAAGYPGEPSKFESRIAGLLAAFRRLKLPPDVVGRFHLMGGECNYLLRINPTSYGLEFVPHEEWMTPVMLAWEEDKIRRTLDDAQALLEKGAARLMMPVHVIRKTRSVGVVPQGQTIYEVLEDLALTVQSNLVSDLPFCAFNGGNDVFVDIGNKCIGLEALMKHLGGTPSQVLHVGDRFTVSGNDAATRDVCSIVWVANPEETGFFIRMLLSDLRTKRVQRYIE